MVSKRNGRQMRYVIYFGPRKFERKLVVFGKGFPLSHFSKWPGYLYVVCHANGLEGHLHCEKSFTSSATMETDKICSFGHNSVLPSSLLACNAIRSRLRLPDIL